MNEIRRGPAEIVIDDLERIKEDTWSAFDSGCLAGAVDLIRDLQAERVRLIAAVGALVPVCVNGCDAPFAVRCSVCNSPNRVEP